MDELLSKGHRNNFILNLVNGLKSNDENLTRELALTLLILVECD